MSLLLTLFMVGVLAGVAARHRQAGEILTRRAEIMEARRIARDLVANGLAGGGAAGPGLQAELELRTFVGVGTPCGDGAWWWRGRRLPDPERDSAWAVSQGGRVWVLPILSVSSGPCSQDSPGRGVRLDLGGSTPRPVLLRLFEHGRYRVTDAVRYARTGSGFQPLTGAVLDPSTSSLSHTGATVHLRIRGRGDSSTVERSWSVR
ncbi:MAG: hypothetical protein JSU98_08580 [Gemmatimonadales bacterium]|nr:MAG: hypothetical protein JSU98_08580 [Gemmatimonadales bacterium]